MLRMSGEMARCSGARADYGAGSVRLVQMDPFMECMCEEVCRRMQEECVKGRSLDIKVQPPLLRC